MVRNRSKGMRYRICLEGVKASGEKNAYGECVAPDPNDGTEAGWELLAELHGSLEDLAGRELFEAQQVRAEVNVRALVRYHPEIKPDRRLNFIDLGVVVNITAVRDLDNRRRELTVEGIREG